MNYLEQKMISSGWFKSGKTIEETTIHFEILGYAYFDITYTIFDMESRKIIQTYPSKLGKCYMSTIQADKELDIGL